jgi:rod shape-determining protein MreC
MSVLGLKKENDFLKVKISKEKNNNQENKIQDEEMKFLKMNLYHGHKCRKVFMNNGYKVGTAEYRKCVLNKGLK